MKPRVLVLSASVCAGHLRAAEAVELALRQSAPEVEVENRDVLDFTNAVFRRFYGQAYLDLVNYFPHFVGYFYDWLEGDGDTRPRTPATAAPGGAEIEHAQLRRSSLAKISGSW